MAFTSQQKHYIKKNIKKLSVRQLADDLELPEKEIMKFLKKHRLDERYGLKDTQSYLEKFSDSAKAFNFHQFISDNFPFFIILFLLVLVTYFNSLNNGFVSDDIAPILKDPNIGKIGTVFSFPVTGFVQRLIYFTAFKLGGLTPIYFRSFNILFHLGSVFLLFTILRILTTRNIALFAAALFAVHPMLSEAVAWISGMPYTLYTFFFLLSLLFYVLRPKGQKYFYCSLVAFALAIIAADNKALVLFLVFPLYELSFGNLKLNWKRAIPYFLLCLFVIITIMSSIGTRLTALNTNYYEDSSGFYNPLIQIPVALSSYLGLLMWPQKLTLYHTEMIFSPLQMVFFWIIILSLMYLAYWGFRKNRMIFFWLSFFVIALLPTLTPLKVAWIVAERYAYLGSIGIFIIIAYFLDWIIKKFNDPRFSQIFYALFAIIIVALSVRTIVRNVDWKDEDHLWPATLAVSPSGAPIHNNMGDVYARAGNFEKAAAEFKKATEINPGYGDAYHNLGNTYQQLQRYPEALDAYQKAVSLNPNIWQSYQNMASIYYTQGDNQKALEFIQKALAINPNDQGLQDNLKVISGQN